MDRTAPELDRRARDLIRTVEPDLRQHLSIDRLDRDLVSELYLQLRAALEGEGREASRALPERLALVVFLVLVARSGEAEIPPALLVSLRRTIARRTGVPEARAERPVPGGSE